MVKKRILALLAAVMLCVSAFGAYPTARAVDLPHFVACNDNLLLLRERFIPIVADGKYYIPYQVLEASSTGINLGVYPVYNAAIRTLTIYNREKVLSFDLSQGICTDRDGRVLSARAMTRDGQIYVPASFVCEYFGLTFSYFAETRYGPMIRICSQTARLTDSQFLTAAQLMMGERLNDWRKYQASLVTPTPVVTPSQTPSVKPTVTPTPTERPTTTPVTPTAPVVDKSDVRTYLAFRVNQPDGVSGIINRLEFYQIPALFFFPADDLARYDEEIRRVLCSGYAVGLTVSGTTEEEILAGAAEGNRVLQQIAYFGTYTILLSDEVGSRTRSAVRDSGMLIWQPDVDAVPNGQTVPDQAESALKKISRYNDRVNILSDCSTSASALMAWMVPELMGDHYDIRLAVETEIG